MSPRKRFAIILGLTVFAIAGSIVYMAARARHWHERGWVGTSFLAGFNAKQQARMMQMKEGQVILVFAGSPADGRLRYGDEILTVDGIPRDDTTRLRVLDARLVKGSQVTYRVKRGDRVMDIPIRLESPLRARMIITTHVVGLLVGLTFVAIGLLIVIRAPGDSRAVIFYTLALLTAVALIGKAATSYESTGARGIVIDPFSAFLSVSLVGILTLMYLPMILHLALVFPRRRPIVEARPYVIRWIYAAAFIACLVLLFALIASSAVMSRAMNEADKLMDRILVPAGYTLLGVSLLVLIHVWWAGRREGFREAILNRPFPLSLATIGVLAAVGRLTASAGWKIVTIILFILGMVLPFLVILAFPFLAVAALYRGYRDANAEEKRQVAWPMWGLLLSVGGKIVIMSVSAILALWITVGHLDMTEWRGLLEILGVIPTLLTLTIPISFAVAILKYRLMNIDVIIKKTVVYAMLSGFILVVYLGLVGILGAILVKYTGVKNQTMVIGATLVVALVFVPMRNKLQALVERNLFRQKYDYPEAIRGLAAEALVATDSASLLASAAEKTQRALQSRAVVIFASRHDDFVAAAKVGVADSIVGTLRIARAQILASLTEPFDPRRAALPDAAAGALARIETALVVPINTPGTPANGFIAVAPKLSGGALDDEDIDFLRAIASQVDVGLDRIRQQREDVDYSQARDIQQGLLPREMPQLAGLDVSGVWQPARTMGGDYYDLLALSDTELAICIGDVAGKGMPAALLMSGLQAAVRASASSSPRDLCERVRRVVVSSLSGGRFVTFFYATIDTAAMRLRWTNAGHNAPILARADGTIVRLSEGGPAFSRLFRDTRYEEQEIALTPGDRVVLFTDGISEAGSAAGEMFGEEQIEALTAAAGNVSAEELVRTIVNAATSFSDDEVEDDMTLVVVCISP